MMKTSPMLFKALFTLCLHSENSNSRREIYTFERLKANEKAVDRPEFTLGWIDSFLIASKKL